MKKKIIVAACVFVGAMALLHLVHLRMTHAGHAGSDAAPHSAPVSR